MHACMHAIIHPSILHRKQENCYCYDIMSSCKTHLVDEGGELVIQSLDLLLLLCTHLLDLRVQLHIQGSQEALVDCNLVDASRQTHRWTIGPQDHTAKHAVGKATSSTPIIPMPKAVPCGPSTATCHTEGSILIPSKTVEAPAAEASHSSVASCVARSYAAHRSPWHHCRKHTEVALVAAQPEVQLPTHGRADSVLELEKDWAQEGCLLLSPPSPGHRKRVSLHYLLPLQKDWGNLRA